MDPKIVVKGNRLLVKDFETEEEEIVSYFKGAKADEIEKRFNSSLRVGVLALKTIGTTEKVDYIEKEFNKLDSKFTKVLDKTKDEISSNIDDTFGERGEVERLVEKYLGENGAFSELLEKQFGEDGVVVKDLFNPTKEGSPICELKKIIVEKLDNLGKSLGIKEAEEKIIEKTALKLSLIHISEPTRPY